MAALYKDQGRYAEAEKLFKEALAIRAKTLSKEHPDYAQSCHNLASLYKDQGRYAEAETLYKEAHSIYAKTLGKEHPDYANSCNSLALLYHYQGRYAEAEPLYKEAHSIFVKTLGKEHPLYALACNNLAGVYENQGRYADAETLYKEAHFIYAKTLGKEHPLYAQSCNNLAALYQDQGRYAEAENLIKEALTIRAKTLGKEHPDYAQSCSNLAGVYENQGRYAEAENLYKEAQSIYAKTLGKEHPNYALSCNNLAALYKDQGRYAEAENLYKEAQSIYAKTLGKEHPNYALSCNNLAALYKDQGRYAEAENLYKEAQSIYAKTLGKEHPNYALSCNNLAALYKDQGHYAEAENLFKESLAIRAKTLGKEHPDYALACNNLAALYKDQGRYAEAEKLFKDAQSIYAKTLGKEHPNYALSCNNLAVLFRAQSRYAEAESLFKEAQSIFAKTLGKEHPDYATACNNLAGLYQDQGRYAEAEKLFKEASQTLIHNIQRNFVGLSEKEKEQYLATLKYHFEIYHSFALKAQKPELSAWLLENNLFTKGLLFFSTQQLRRTAEKSQNPKLQATYHEWINQRRQLAKAYEMTQEKRKEQNISLENLEKQANELEKQLSLLLAQEGYSFQLSPTQHSWQEIKQKLKSDEAIVEISRFRYHDKKWTDSVLYMALVVKKNSPYPEMVLLPNGKDLETGEIAFYRNHIRFRKQDKASYGVFFEPIAQKLKGIRKIYFSADGVYHQINLATLYNPKTQKYLDEELSIQLISTARDFIELNTNKKLQKQLKEYRLYLFGYPDFANKPASQQPSENRAVIDVALVSRIDKKQRFFDELSGTVTYLPGTKKEVEGIASIAKQAKIENNVFLEKQASEENLKKISSANILHIATHGFFIETQEDNKNKEAKFDNPLLRAGLLLSGAELSLNKKETGSTENGILTAQEALGLDLQRTDLVVLSACETGLGEVKSGEGVFGLQRALQEAGAKSVIMSLWKVDDNATQEFMNLFYKNMLLKKQDKRTAFQNAQNKMKRKYSAPYYWGAFVMVGE
ncbi:CHAT domain [Raineya orbicola]|uniref:CHAT domain n=1 Tax=Raineya orbicola TaxID=2016530 RepID=A0A2N3IHG4_9BACT|nr:CHAT domain [Raineya orbicola]